MNTLEQTKEDIELEIIKNLRVLKYIGYFPGNTEVLLVSLSNALDETKRIDLNYSLVMLKNLLKKKNILVFSNLEDYTKYLGRTKSKKT